jgi:tape measure domain-containing protein
MANVATLTAKMAFDVSQFQRGVSVVVSGVSRMEGGIAGVAKMFAGGAAGALVFTGAMKAVSTSLNLVATAADKAVDAFVFGAKLASEAELAEVGFKVMIGSAERARKLMKDLESFAIQTPFAMGGLQEATKTLLGSGFSDTQVIPTLKTLGNVVGGNVEKLQHLVLVFGQIQARGKLTADNFRQITEAGINMRRELADEVGVAITDLDKAMERGEISFAEFRNALIEVSDTRFGGRLDAESKTAIGALNRIREVSGGIMKDIAKGFAEKFDTSGWMNDFAGFLEYVRATWVPALTAGLVAVMKSMADMFDGMRNELAIMARMTQTMSKTLAEMMRPKDTHIPGVKLGDAGLSSAFSLQAQLAGNVAKQLEKPGGMRQILADARKAMQSLAPDSEEPKGMRKSIDWLSKLEDLTSEPLAMMGDKLSGTLDGIGTFFKNTFMQRGEGDQRSQQFQPTQSLRAGSAEAFSAMIRNMYKTPEAKEELKALHAIEKATSKTASAIERAVSGGITGLLDSLGSG